MRRMALAFTLASMALPLLALPAAAADLTGGCRLEARSFDSTGATLDEGIAPGPVGSQDDPFQVDWNGSVDFLFVTPQVFQNNRWDVRVFGLPVLSGDDDNPSDIDERGVVEIGSVAPIRMVGLFHVEGDLYGNGDTAHCHGDGWVYLVGDPIGTVPWIVAAALILAGLLGLVATPYSTTWETDPTSGEALHSGAVTSTPAANRTVEPAPPPTEPPPDDRPL